MVLAIQPMLMAYPAAEDEKEFVLSGRVLDKGKAFPVAAKIEIKDVRTHQGVAIYFSDEKTGKYLFVLNPGIYRIEVEAEGYYYTSENLVIKPEDDENIKKTLFIEAIPKGVIAERPFPEEPEEIEETPPLAGESGNPVLPESEFEIIEIIPVDSQVIALEDTFIHEIDEYPSIFSSRNISSTDESSTNTTSDPVIAGAAHATKTATSNSVSLETSSAGMTDPLSEKYVRNGDDSDAVKIKLRDGFQFLDITLEFEQGMSDLNRAIIDELLTIVPYLKINDHVVLEVGGHTDSLVSSDLSYSLSIERAKAVYSYLVQHGIENTRLKIIGYAKSHPIETNASELGRLMNRRVELKIIGDKDTMMLAEATSLKIDPVPILYDYEIDSINNLIVYYKKRKTKLLPETYGILDAIVGFMNKHDYTEMAISTYTDSKVRAKKARKICVKRNAAVVQYLIDKDIPNKRLVWKSKGRSNAVKRGTKQEIALSNRTEFEVSGIIRGTGAKPTRVTLELVPEELPLDLDALFYFILEKYGDLKISGLIFSIQVGAFTAALPDDAQLFFLVKEVRVDLSTGLTRYVVGEFETLASGHEYRLGIQEDGVRDAFVYGTYKGERLTLEDLAELLKSEAAGE